MLKLPSTVTTTGQTEVLWISAISSCCTSRYVPGDNITRDRPVEKYLWLMYVRQRTKWISCKLWDVDGSSAPFVIALKRSITNNLTSNFSFCKKGIFSFAQYPTIPYFFDYVLFLSQEQEYDSGIGVMTRVLFPYFIGGCVILIFPPHIVSVTLHTEVTVNFLPM